MWLKTKTKKGKKENAVIQSEILEMQTEWGEMKSGHILLKKKKKKKESLPKKSGDGGR